MTGREGSLLWGAVLIGGAVAVAIGVVFEPAITAACMAIALLFVVAQRGVAKAPEVFLGALVVLLVGYAWFGRGFAYLGVRPFFVGEVVLALGLIALFTNAALRRHFHGAIVWVLSAYVIWGASRTLPYVSEYGFVALRDAVVWGYGVFALLVYLALLYTGSLKRAVVGYSLFLPWFLLWAPFALWLSKSSGDWGLFVPGSPDVALIGLKPGDVAIHLAGGAIFLALGLYAFGRRSTDPGLGMKEWLWWTLWLAGFLFAASANRGGLLSILVAGAVAFALRPGARWMKGVFVGLLLAGTFVISNVEIETGQVRKTSPQQIVANLASVFGEAPREGLQGSRRWRQEWWSDIVQYTVLGPYFWTGKGFGINLAIDDGIVSARSTLAVRLRSPHNGHLTILARSGVPGFLLWIFLNGMFFFSLLRVHFLARRLASEWWARLDIWIIAYWAAFMVNISFDVFLEGPQGGIFYWSLFGAGMAAIDIQRRSFAEMALDPRPSPSRRGEDTGVEGRGRAARST